MKKLLMTFVTAALLTVCLCVPAFAACEHEYDSSTSKCALCGEMCSHFYSCDWSLDYEDFSSGFTVVKGEQTCVGCGTVLTGQSFVYPWLHETDSSLLTSLASFSFNGVKCLTGAEYEAAVSAVNSGAPATLRSVNDFMFLYLDGYDLPLAFFSVVNAWLPSNTVTLAHAGATESDLQLFHDSGYDYVTLDSPLAFYGLLSNPDFNSIYDPGAIAIFPSITSLVTASIDWLTAFALCIISTPLFLIFVCCIFVGLGIALIKRSIHL